MGEESQVKREDRFVQFVLEIIKRDKGARASLRRADHETTEYQSWEYLARWCDLQKEGERRAFGLIAASLARGVPEKDGKLGLGQAIASAYTLQQDRTEEHNAPAKARLRRLLSCKSSEEAVLVLRSILKLLDSRGVLVNHAALLGNLLFFDTFADRIKTGWAQEFYGRGE
ncbi:MAG: type I-E CRISPR-associated protein Cse2/CasB [Spirochaetales bacterium]|nr:type I-E CRISPR-associated protein Cse2/CasB [Spirochaetales bacterium]